MIKIEDWPEELAWVAAELKTASRQRGTRFPVQSGPDRVRKTGTPYPVLEATITMTGVQWSQLQGLLNTSYGPYRMGLFQPDRTGTVYFDSEPLVLEERYSASGNAIRKVVIVLRER